LKDYNYQVFWTVYFDSTKSRSQGRRVPKDKATRSPTLDELFSAAKSKGYQGIEKIVARHPKFSTATGYISIPKDERKRPKSAVILELARALSRVRGKQNA
jgi:signal recognition particle subunit SRP19